VLKEVVETHVDTALSIHVVWMPMVPGDSREAAQKTGAMFAGEPVHQYYDGERLAGAAYMRDAFADCLTDALQAVPEDHPVYAQLKEWPRSGRSVGPLWDAVLFYPPNVQWADQAPRPKYWSKQVGFFGPGAGAVTGTFFRNDCKQPPVDSDWFREVRNVMGTLLAKNNRRPAAP
jgi:hypothetical protein